MRPIPNLLVRVIEASDELNDERAQQLDELGKLGLITRRRSNLLNRRDEGADECNAFLVCSTAHHWCDSLLDLSDLIEAAELKAFRYTC